jgi:dipeptidyl aminopeptidase/acylaminoacyl peptidase
MNNIPSFPPVEQGYLNTGDQLVISWDREFPVTFSNQVYVLNNDGTVEQLTHISDAGAYLFLESPDNRRLILQKDYAGTRKVYLMENAKLHEITPAYYVMQWSPDGKQLLTLDFPSISYFRYDLETEQYTPLNLGNTYNHFIWGEDGLVTITNNAGMEINYYDPETQLLMKTIKAGYLNGADRFTFSPSGKKIAFVAYEDEMPSLTVINVDGSERRKITNLHEYNVDENIVWSPDESKLAFVDIEEEDAYYGLYVINGDGSGRKRLIDLNTGDESGEVLPFIPVWSPDGTQIAIPSFLKEGSTIFVMNIDGSNLRRVIEPQGLIHEIMWKPRDQE